MHVQFIAFSHLCDLLRVQAATTRDGGAIGQLLWQLVASSAHIIVPIAAFNLKVPLLITAKLGFAAHAGCRYHDEAISHAQLLSG